MPDGGALHVDGVFLTDAEDGAEFAATLRDLRLAPGQGLAGRVWRTRQPAWIPDLADDQPFPALPPTELDGPRGTLAFPIISDGEVLLVLQLSSDDPTAPDPGTLEVLESTFQNVLQFAERREAEAAERRLAAEQAALRRVATLDRPGRGARDRVPGRHVGGGPPVRSRDGEHGAVPAGGDERDRCSAAGRPASRRSPRGPCSRWTATRPSRASARPGSRCGSTTTRSSRATSRRRCASSAPRRRSRHRSWCRATCGGR